MSATIATYLLVVVPICLAAWGWLELRLKRAAIRDLRLWALALDRHVRVERSNIKGRSEAIVTIRRALETARAELARLEREVQR